MTRVVGLVYLLAFVADALISWASLVTPSLETFSNTFSLCMYPFAALVLVLAFMRRLQPLLAFLVPAALYAAFFWLAIALSTALSVKAGPGADLDLTREEVSEYFPWYEPALLVLVLVQLAVGAGSLWRFLSEPSPPA